MKHKKVCDAPEKPNNRKNEKISIFQRLLQKKFKL